MKKLPTWVEIDLDSLERNFDTIEQRLAGHSRILLLVKADAYGHGAAQIARASAKRVHMFGVATVDEAIELKDAGLTNAILILSPILDTEIPAVVEGGFSISVSSYRIAQRTSDYAVSQDTRVGAHIEIDTGMGRTGISEKFGREEIEKISALAGIRLDGVYTHFPVSDTDSEFTRAQVARFQALIDRVRADGVDIPVVHSANSAAVDGIAESHMDLVRPGLLVYGLHPSGNDARPKDIVSVLSWKSRLVRIRRIPAGHSISYGRTYVTTRDSVIGVVPAGYGHGYPYRLSNRGEMLVAGYRVPVIGRVTMDMTMVDLTDVPGELAPGEEVVLVGRQGDAEITFHDVAGWADTIAYEVMCGISRRVPRTYFRRGRVETYRSLLGVLPNHVAS